MFRRVMEGFTATHATIIALGAMFVPSTLYAVVSYQPVAIVNANTGNKAQVDTSGRLFTYSPISDLPISYAFSPGNLVKVSATCNSSNAGSTIYTPPSGKALIVKNANFTYYNGTSGSDNYIYLIADSSYIAGGESSDPVNNASMALSYYTTGSLSLSCASTGSYISSVTGFLVPSSAVPAGADAAQQAARSGPRIVKGGKTL